MTDISETYMKMCEQAPIELKNESFPRDLVKHVVEGIVVDDRANFWSLKRIAVGKQATQLFRQDQLQEMVGDYLTVRDYILGIGYKLDEYPLGLQHTDPFVRKYIEVFTSMEQLWLAIVMWEKCRKVWDGSEWVKEDANL